MTFTVEQQQAFIRLAMQEVDRSIAAGCPPFGAIVVGPDGDVVASGHNTASVSTDMTCHAEMNIIRDLAQRLHIRKLTGYAVFINAASCSMCASAMIQAGARDFYYGAPFEPHTNPAVSYTVLQQYCNEPLTVVEGILADECKAQIERGRAAQAAQ